MPREFYYNGFNLIFQSAFPRSRLACEQCECRYFSYLFKKNIGCNLLLPYMSSNIKVSSPWAYHLVVVVELACLNEPNSDAGGGFIPSKVKNLILSFLAH